MDNIFQIFLCKEKYREENLREHAEFFNTARQNMLAVYPDYQYNLYTNVEAARFVKAFSPEVHRAYWTFAPFAYRADLLRLCLLYEYGGWYFDITTKPLFKFEPDKDFFAKNDASYYKNVGHSGHGLIENFVVYAKPKSKFLELCIEQIVDNALNQRYFTELSTLKIAGPMLISNTLEKNQHLKSTVDIGIFNHSIQSIVVDGKIFAEHKNKDPEGPSSPPRVFKEGLSYIGFKGTNSYNKLHYHRAVYITPWTAAILRNVTDTQEIAYA